MILEFLSLTSLAAVLIIKYVTTSHLSALRQEISEHITEHRRARGRKQLMIEQISETESKEQNLQGTIRKFENQLDEVQRELMEMETRNSELQEQMDEVL